MAAIIVHGGAYAIKDEHTERNIHGCTNAVKAGYKILEHGGSSIDAVEAAIRSLEDDYSFNAGHGSALNKNGDVEMDAMIMDGKDLQLGAVGGIQCVANPISVARLVMDKTDHTMLIGNGAKQLANEHGVPHVNTEQLLSPEMKLKRDKFDQYNNVVGATFNIDDHTLSIGHDTVGSVAIDNYGNIACGTSTGGITLKKPGRIGDSPLIGCGGLADNTIGGVSTTGHGESITRVMLANRVLSLLATMSIDEAIRQSLQYMYNKTNGRGGLIMITNNGDIGKGFTTQRMVWASIDKNGLLQTGINEPKIAADDN